MPSKNQSSGKRRPSHTSSRSSSSGARHSTPERDEEGRFESEGGGGRGKK